MPAALQVDWGAAKTLYLGGVDTEHIAKQLGIPYHTVRQRARRKDWNSERENMRKLVREHPAQLQENVSQTVARAIAGTFSTWKQEAIDAVAEAGALVAKSLRDEVTREGATLQTQSEAFTKFEPASKVLKPFLGLGDGTAVNVSVGVNILSELPAEEVTDI